MNNYYICFMIAKRFFYLFLLSLALISCESPRSHYVRVFKSIDLEVNHNSQAHNILNGICSHFGPRLAGCEKAIQAEEYSSLLFRSYGYDQVFFQPFSFTQWIRGSASLEIDSAGVFRPVPSLALAYTPSARINGRIVDVGNGLIEDYSGLNVSGKIVLVYLGLLPGTPAGVKNMSRACKLSFAIAQGAAGCIAINQEPGDLPVTGSVSFDGQIIKIPALSISYNRGMQLKEQLKTRSCLARITTNNTSRPVTARNVVARLEGNRLPDETIVIGAHLDSWDISPGALDNASGVASVLDIARLFKSLNLQPARTIDFVLFMAEEQGHYGSESYIEEARHQNRLDGIRYMFNHDMTVSTYGFNLMCRYESDELFQEMGLLMQKADTSYANSLAHFTYLGSDHAVFIFEGIPTFTPLNRYEPTHTYHTTGDGPDHITSGMLESNVKLSAMMLYILANAETLPANRFTPEQVRQYLIDNNLQEELVISGAWIWD